MKVKEILIKRLLLKEQLFVLYIFEISTEKRIRIIKINPSKPKYNIMPPLSNITCVFVLFLKISISNSYLIWIVLSESTDFGYSRYKMMFPIFFQDISLFRYNRKGKY